MKTIRELITSGRPDNQALLGPGFEPVTYAALGSAVDRLSSQLAGIGVRKGDRVALVLPNGPELAQLFLASACYATAAPLNPKYREDEFRFYLTDLRAKVLITLRDDAPAATKAAPADTALLFVERDAGGVTLCRPAGEKIAPAEPEKPRAADTALVLHTSGTTSRPKIVPLTQENLTTSALSIAKHLGLAPSDRCLNPMPLFHIHGLVAGLLAPLASGGSAVIPPGFDAFKFLDWLEEFRPTWYTAVPTMHQLVLERASRQPERTARLGLRFIRSSSASLAPVVLEQLERTFGVPVIEAYGMTEASHEMASNPLPPARRKPGSVGKPTAVEIAIMDGSGRLLPPGHLGEVVIRGKTVTAGYLDNPEANERAFTAGWFRTGDQGYFDEDGYLFLTGRLKEIINRGGEKVSPLEVEAVLMQHPAVKQTVAFGAPHPKLGEEVAACVVLADGAQATERDLRAFAARHLADFKVPKKIVIVPEIPRGPTGKLQRIGMAERLGVRF
ncbi:putative sulfoacetate--CoA ligase [bacterium HR33]|nr:putative sulfoacetate--CoA ligase [bacterium HR33]